MELRPLQQRFVEDIRTAFRSNRRVLAVAATGFGKTVCFSYMAKGAAERGNRTMILTHREELIRQIQSTLGKWGATADVQSVQTVARRLETTEKPDLIIVDEAHHSMATTWARVLTYWPNVKILGVTATPARLDGRGLKDQFDSIVIGPDAGQLIREGWLVKPRYFAPPTKIDTSELSINGGDYRRDELELVVDRPGITGDAVEHYKRMASGVSAIAFCVSRAHAENVCAAFVAGGVTAEVFHGGIADRESVMNRYRAGETKVLITVDLVGEGLDVPACGAVILLRPTASLCLHLQQIGRGLRIAEGKTCCWVLDHAGNTLKHGLAEWPREWTLEGKKKKSGEMREMGVKRCDHCFAVMAAGCRQCPECGTLLVDEEDNTKAKAGDLTEIVSVNCPKCNRPSIRGAKCNGCKVEEKREEYRCRTLSDWQLLAKKRGYSPGWAFVRYTLRKKRAYA